MTGRDKSATRATKTGARDPHRDFKVLEPGWHKAWRETHAALGARAERFRLPQGWVEWAERLRQESQQEPVDYSRLDRALAHELGITSSPAPKVVAPGAKVTVKDRVTAVAQQMRDDGEISASVLRSHFAKELAQRIGKPDSERYIRKELAEWGLWPTALISVGKPAKSMLRPASLSICFALSFLNVYSINHHWRSK